MYKWSLGVCCIASSIALSAASGAAEPWVAPSGPQGAGLGMIDRSHGRAWIDTVGYTDSDGTVLSNIVGVGFQPIGPAEPAPPNEPVHGVEVEAMLPFGMFFGDESPTALGNPFLSGSYLYTGPDLRARVGLGLAFPVADADSLDEVFALAVAFAVRGMQDAWLWAPDALTIASFGRVEFDASDAFTLTLDAALAELVPVRDRDEADTIVQATPGFAVRAGDVFSAGLRATVVAVPTSDASDVAQFSVEPFVRANFGPGFVSARFIYNIDEPLGPSFDDGAWGAGLGGGVAF